MAQVTRGVQPEGLAVHGMPGRSVLFLLRNHWVQSRPALLLITRGRSLALGDKVFLLLQSKATFSTSRLLPQILWGNRPGRCNQEQQFGIQPSLDCASMETVARERRLV